jgi:hypothetical protein
MKQTAMLLQQSVDGMVTIEKGSIPVILIDSDQPSAQVVMMVNFLRNGSPSVELLLSDYALSHKTDVKQFIEKVLSKLSLPGEKFRFQDNVADDSEVLVVDFNK